MRFVAVLSLTYLMIGCDSHAFEPEDSCDHFHSITDCTELASPDYAQIPLPVLSVMKRNAAHLAVRHIHKLVDGGRIPREEEPTEIPDDLTWLFVDAQAHAYLNSRVVRDTLYEVIDGRILNWPRLDIISFGIEHVTGLIPKLLEDPVQSGIPEIDAFFQENDFELDGNSDFDWFNYMWFTTDELKNFRPDLRRLESMPWFFDVGPANPKHCGFGPCQDIEATLWNGGVRFEYWLGWGPCSGNGCSRDTYWTIWVAPNGSTELFETHGTPIGDSFDDIRN